MNAGLDRFLLSEYMEYSDPENPNLRFDNLGSFDFRDSQRWQGTISREIKKKSIFHKIRHSRSLTMKTPYLKGGTMAIISITMQDFQKH